MIELTVELCFKIIKQNHKRYFKSKELVDEIIVREFETPYIEIKYNNTDLTKLKEQIKRKIIPILHDLKENGMIEKYSKKFWKIKEVGATGK